MAKRSRPSPGTKQSGSDEDVMKSGHDTSMLAGAGEAPGGGASDGESADALGDFAADLGKFLGTVQTRATSWLDQRKAIADQLTQIRDTANQYLHQLTGGSTGIGTAVRRGRRRAPAQGQGQAQAEPKRGGVRRKLSAAARKRISDAQKARWARHRKGSE